MKSREEVLASIKQWPTSIDDVNAPDGWSWSYDINNKSYPVLRCRAYPDQIITIGDWVSEYIKHNTCIDPLTIDVSEQPIKAHEFLERGAQHMRDRAVQRDTSDGERSMRRAVEAFNAQEGTNLTEAQGWRFMIQLKYARAVNGVFVADDYEDMAAYAGLAGESAQ